MHNIQYNLEIKELIDNIQKIEGQYLFLTDPNINELYSQFFENHFSKIDQKYKKYILNCGEENKSMKNIELALDQMLTWSFDRNDQIICLGGGIICDFGGFLASIYMRGIKHILIPTSLLAMVDAAIGGKTGVNHQKGKNLIGAFYFPKQINICLEFLETLDRRNFNNGMAEVIKAAAIQDKKLFEFLMTQNINIKKNQLYVIKKAIEIKVDIVQKDEKESNLRKLLNFGHTIGHGIELACNILHGEAVSIGMVLESEISNQKGLTVQSEIDQLIDCLQKFELPINIPNDCEKVMNYIKMDKKKEGDKIKMIFIQSIGKSYPKIFSVTDQEILNVIDNQIIIQSTQKIDNQIEANILGSKSISNRCLILVALSKQQVKLNNFLISEDTKICLTVLTELKLIKKIEINNEYIIIQGLGIHQETFYHQKLYFENSGTSLRFIIPILLLLKGSFILKGNQYMNKRPIQDLLTVIQKQGATIEYLEENNQLPFILNTNGKFQGGNITIDGQQSSQFISGLLMVSPYAQNQVHLQVLKFYQAQNIVSEQFIDMTIRIMNDFKVKVEQENHNYKIQQGEYKANNTYQIELDLTSASYCLTYIALVKGSIKIKNVNTQSSQVKNIFKKGDLLYATEFLQTIGLKIELNQDLCVTSNVELQAFDINFEKMTDTFMSACIIAATINSSSTIRGIANQKVKECNRIKAMIKNFKKLNIYCEELDDGLKIFGMDIQKSNSKKYITIKTYSDHRIAMSFTILAAYYFQNDHHIQIIIDNKQCVKKTFPTFYNHIQKDLKIKIQSNNQQEFKQQDNIILLGMRGAGKTTLQDLITQKLNINQLDLDELIKTDQGDIIQLVYQQGWEQFRKIEHEILKNILKQNLNSFQVIGCGGGVIETKANRNLLKLQKGTIYINKYIEDIKVDLKLSMRPNLPQEFTKTFDDREVYYQESKYVFTLPIKNDDLHYYNRINSIFIDALKRKFLNKRMIFLKEDSFFLCTFIDDLMKNINKYQMINQEYDCLEIRVDKNMDDIKSLQFKMAQIKYYIKIPIIITLRSVQEGGFFQGNYQKSIKFLANQLIFDIIDIEFNSNNIKLIQKLSKSYTIIVSKHFNNDEQTLEIYQKLQEFCEKMNKYNLVVIMKLVLNSDKYINYIREQQKFLKTQSIIISGKISRIQQKFLLPVYDPQFSEKTNINQITKQEAQISRNSFNQNMIKKYYIIRENADKSLSPDIHNLAFQLTQRNDCTYLRLSPENEQQIEDCIKSDDFYGASISMPYKKSIMKYCDFIESKVDNVNTLVKFNNKIYGFNTDIYGIYQPLAKLIQQNYKNKNQDYGIILGSGQCAVSAIQAFEQLNLIPIIFCRTQKDYIKQQTFTNYNDLEQFVKNKEIKVIFSALPPQNDIFIQLNKSIFLNKPIVYDSNYNTQSQLLRLAQKNNCIIIEGITMLIYQAFKQIELFTGKKVQRKIFKQLFIK